LNYVKNLRPIPSIITRKNTKALEWNPMILTTNL
jgi:hypothetical protein